MSLDSHLRKRLQQSRLAEFGKAMFVHMYVTGRATYWIAKAYFEDDTAPAILALGFWFSVTLFLVGIVGILAECRRPARTRSLAHYLAERPIRLFCWQLFFAALFFVAFLTGIWGLGIASSIADGEPHFRFSVALFVLLGSYVAFFVIGIVGFVTAWRQSVRKRPSRMRAARISFADHVVERLKLLANSGLVWAAFFTATCWLGMWRLLANASIASFKLLFIAWFALLTFSILPWIIRFRK